MSFRIINEENNKEGIILTIEKFHNRAPLLAVLAKMIGRVYHAKEKIKIFKVLIPASAGINYWTQMCRIDGKEIDFYTWKRIKNLYNVKKYEEAS